MDEITYNLVHKRPKVYPKGCNCYLIADFGRTESDPLLTEGLRYDWIYYGENDVKLDRYCPVHHAWWTDRERRFNRGMFLFTIWMIVSVVLTIWLNSWVGLIMLVSLFLPLWPNKLLRRVGIAQDDAPPDIEV